MELPNRKPEKTIIPAISIGFTLWSAAFIFRSSFIAIDGKRYFCLFDDAMISMRYAWNFSHGLGLVWNHGEHIQGYTNLLMTLLMSLATLVFGKSTAALSIQILGVGCMLAIAYTSMTLADHIVPNENRERQGLARVLSFFCALSYYPLVYWSLMGMETGLLTLLLLLAILFAFNYTKSQNPTLLLAVAGFSGLAYLTRNDSILFLFLIWSYILWDTFHTRTHRNTLWFLLAATGICVTFVLGQLIFQYLYYGELLPNTYTLKLTGMPLLERLRNGVRFVTPYLLVTAPILLLPIVDLVFEFRKKKALLLSIMCSSICYQVYVGGDPWNRWRIMAPAMPLVFILFVNAINAIIFAISQPFNAYFLRNPIYPRRYMAEALATSLILIGLLSANVRFLLELSLLTAPHTARDNKENINTAIVLSRLTTSSATVGVYWAGAIPYFTGRRAIDFLGKCDKYIAHLPPDVSGKVSWSGMSSVPGHNKYDLNYSVKVLEPTYVQGFQWGAQDLSQWAETRYAKVEYEGVSLFLLKDSPAVLWSKINVP